MVFATIAKLRGRSLPVNFVAATQSVFFVLLLSMVVYVSFFDVRRWARDAQSDRAVAASEK
jgi:regulator of sigma E protease